MPTSSHDAHPIIAKLESILTLSDEEKGGDPAPARCRS
jgi:hypothetical protein